MEGAVAGGVRAAVLGNVDGFRADGIRSHAMLPGRQGHLPRLRPDAVRWRQGRHPRPGSISHARRGDGLLLLGAGREPAAAQPAEHLPGTPQRPWPRPPPDRPFRLGAARRVPAEQRADRACPRGRFARQQGLGNLHRQRDTPPIGAARAHRLHPVGQLCDRQEGADRRPQAPGHHLAASVAVLGAQGFFGSKPFSRANDYLAANSQAPIVWA